MFVSSGGYTGPQEIKYLFIDGGCLRQFVDDCGKRYQGFSIGQMAWNKLAHGYSKIFYYDSLPPKKSNEEDKAYESRVAGQEAFFDDLRTIPGMHVYEGDARRRRKIVQQKKVDIMIAVDMLTHSFRRNMHQASLLTADLDFKPLVDALVRDGMQIELWYPQGKPNKELIYAADRRRPLTFRDLHSWSKEAYQAAHPLPEAHSKKGNKNIQGGFLKDKWTTAMKTTAEVYEMQSGDSYTVVFPSAQNQDKNVYIYVSHSDLDLLKIYVHECFREFWGSSI